MLLVTEFSGSAYGMFDGVIELRRLAGNGEINLLTLTLLLGEGANQCHCSCSPLFRKLFESAS